MKSFQEQAFVFGCQSERLVGVLAQPHSAPELGVLIVVGGPQYRVGSHRQFVHLARHLARQGIACMRFDYRGMGDSEGAPRTFEEIGWDIGSAVDAFLARVPSLSAVTLWGLCDGATAACFYAWRDARIGGLVLVNPWVRTAAGEARAVVQTYYHRRLLEADFWRKLLSGRVHLGRSTLSLLQNLALSFASWRKLGKGKDKQRNDQSVPLPQRVAQSVGRFTGRVLVILSGNDLTAAEFDTVARNVPGMKKAFDEAKSEWIMIPEANHTFSSQPWKEALAEATTAWLQRGRRPECSMEEGYVELLQR